MIDKGPFTPLCPHGRHNGAVCEDCNLEADIYQPDYKISECEEVCVHGIELQHYCPYCFTEGMKDDPSDVHPFKPAFDRLCDPWLSSPSGLDAPYYDFPSHVNDAQGLIEWLEDGGLTWSCANILKSIIREYNPDVAKETTPLYEAEKRAYYADRGLSKVREKNARRASNGEEES